jgi:hypothetical protein
MSNGQKYQDLKLKPTVAVTVDVRYVSWKFETP